MCINPQWLEPVRKFELDEVGNPFPVGVTWRFAGARASPPGALIDAETGEAFEPFQVGCGQCLECIQVHKIQWVHRLQDEQKLHKDSCFLTLTYNPENLPPGGVFRKEMQDFMKRLRKAIDPVPVRYFLCGEYGSQGKRPHYHVALFGYAFPDRYRFEKDKKGFWICRSPELEKLWEKGFSSVQDLGPHSMEYVTKDMQKLLPLEDGRNPPFVSMSLKPGIGVGAWDRRLSDGKIWHNGKSCPIPRYYKKVAEREGLDLEPLKIKQILIADQRAELDPAEHAQNYQRKVEKLKEKLNK